MLFKYNSTSIKRVNYNGTVIKDLIFNGTQVHKMRTLTINITLRLTWHQSLSTPNIPTIPLTVNGETFNITNSLYTRTRISNPSSSYSFYVDKCVYSGTFDIINNSSIALSFRNFPKFEEGFYQTGVGDLSYGKPIITASTSTDVSLTFNPLLVWYYASDSDAEATLTTSPTLSFVVS